MADEGCYDLVGEAKGVADGTPALETGMPKNVPQIQNLVATASMGCVVDLKTIAVNLRNVQYSPWKFSAATIHLSEPRTSTNIFNSGVLVCTAAKSEEDARLATRKVAGIVKRLGFPAQYLNFKIENIVASADVGFSISLEGLAKAHGKVCKYDSERSPGLAYKMTEPKVTIMIFVSGKINIMGAKSRSEIDEAYEKIIPVIIPFKKQ